MNVIYFEDGVSVNGEFFKLQEIVAKCNVAKVEKKGLCLLTILWPSGRGCPSIKEAIVMNNAQIECFKKEMVGKQVYFGEIAGKHSEIYGDISEEDFTISADPEKVAAFLAIHPDGHDYNYSFIERFVLSLEDNEDWDDEKQAKRELKKIQPLKDALAGKY